MVILIEDDNPDHAVRETVKYIGKLEFKNYWLNPLKPTFLNLGFKMKL